ncbi:DUF3244 domain-containing protein [Bacteroidales bacterium OttesenSCG-928-I14]|nr:DUF3244 domain-containing protein [Bacteroidales bacterium OttesenSCG-928-I14]
MAKKIHYLALTLFLSALCLSVSQSVMATPSKKPNTNVALNLYKQTTSTPKVSSVLIGTYENGLLSVDFEGEVSNEYITIKITSLTGEGYIYTSTFVNESGILRLNLDLEDGDEYSIVILSEDVRLEGEM